MAEANRDEIAKLEALFAANPDGRIFTHLAEAYRKAGELDRALEVLQRGLERHAEYSSAYVVLGRVQAGRGDAPAARAAFRRVLELDAHNLVALRAMGDLAYAERDTEDALHFYRQLLQAEPGDDELAELIGSLEAEESARSAAEASAFEEEPALETSPGEDSGEIERIDLNFAGDTSSGFAESEAEYDAPGFQPGILDLAFQEDPDAELPAFGHEEAAETPVIAGSEAASESSPEEEAVGAEAAMESSPEQHVAGSAEPEEAEAPPPVVTPPAAAGAAGAGELVTETMGDLYALQGLHERAAEVYSRLLRDRPGDAGLLEKLERASAGGAASSGEVESDAAAEPATDSGFGEEDPESAAASGTAAAEAAQEEGTWTHAAADQMIEASEAAPDAASGAGLETEEQVQERLAAEVQQDPEVAASMEGYFEELFGEGPPVPPIPPRESAPPIGGEDGGAETTFADSFFGAGDEEPFPFAPTTPTMDSVAGPPPASWDDYDFRDAGSAAEAADTGVEFPEAGDVPLGEQGLAHAEEDEAENLEQIESAWTGGQGASSTEPTPYAWSEEGETEEAGEPLRDYLGKILSWRPARTAAPEIELPPAEAASPFAEAEVPPTRESRGEGPRGDDIDALFSAPAPVPVEAPLTAREAPPAPAEGADEEQDLEMFRAWLQSLKH